jgi:hypothetical protein
VSLKLHVTRLAEHPRVERSPIVLRAISGKDRIYRYFCVYLYSVQLSSWTALPMRPHMLAKTKNACVRHGFPHRNIFLSRMFTEGLTDIADLESQRFS